MIKANIILEMNNGFSVKCWQKAGADTGGGAVARNQGLSGRANRPPGRPK